ncbi:39S ribosomal protein L32, mitochondrial [Anopheles darlingi]|uniref:Large ribosomal subunit protein bL32m n=1 Tax=Anopheles darlingi TaxID=43151 RepID=W5JV86_ANODA|nr:39S ribosomal protein L32, mitochondrial [Anopheles darlingi]ETN68081.1 39S ribosomal protein L32, mitochondrial [Anopheles darlingi]
MARLLRRLVDKLQGNLLLLEHHFFGGNQFPPGGLALVGIEQRSVQQRRQCPPSGSFSLRDLLGDGILWAVPKHRRTVEKRHKRKYGSPEYKLKILTPKTHLRSCATCGSDHEVGVLCPTCYRQVRTETEQMQEKIQQELKLDPVDREVVILYANEKEEQPAEFWQDKRIVEMEKPRPLWFSKNLLQKATQTTDPDELKPGADKLG